MGTPGTPICITAETRFILSTSGRPSSLQRFRCLLQDILKLDLAYIPISAPEKKSSASESDQNTSHVPAKIDPERFVWALKGMNCIGGAISRDIKHSVIPFLDEVDDFAQKVQSVNTVVRSGDRLKGFNTDAIGFRHAIETGINNSEAKVKAAVVYGYGGVSSVVFHVLKELGIEVFVTGRRPDQVSARAEQFDVRVFKAGECCCDLFVNAAPVTDTPLENVPNFMDALAGCKIAFDHEMPGKYLKQYCEAQRVTHISGLDMYYPQMHSQWALFLDGLIDDTNKIPELITEAEAAAS